MICDSCFHIIFFFQNYRFLDLLHVLCVCDNVAIPNNQSYIVKKWLQTEQVFIYKIILQMLCWINYFNYAINKYIIRETFQFVIFSSSELVLFNVKWAIFQLYHGENNLHFDEMKMMSDLYQTNTISSIFIVVDQSSNRPQRDMSPDSDTSSWIQPFFVLTCTS